MHRERLEERRLGASRAHGGFTLTSGARALVLVAAAATLLPVVRPAPAGAQSPDEYWRTLSAEQEPTLVLAEASPATIPDAVAEGLRLFRVYELTGDEDAARRARELLRDAPPKGEHRPWQALALAMVYARGPNSRMRTGDSPDAWFVDPNSLGSAWSLRLLRGALEEHPDFREAALELAAWAIDRDRPDVAAEAEIALAGLSTDGDVLLARASLNLLLEDYARAATLAAEAERAGADPGLARHVQATALLQDPATADRGSAVYYEGAGSLGQAGRRAYARVLEPVLSDADRETWRALPDAEVRAWVERWWSRSAARSGVTPVERLAEHYRRLQRARIDFPPTAPLSVLQIQSAFATGEDSRRYALSLRGLMLVRHGDPYRLAHLEACLSSPWTAPGVGIICPELGRERLAVFQRTMRSAAGETFSPFVRPLPFGHGVYAFRGSRGGADVVFAATVPARSANALVDGTGELAGLLSAILLPDSGDVIRTDSAFRTPLPGRLHAMAGENDALALLHAKIEGAPGDASYEYRMTLSDPSRYAGTTIGGHIELPALEGFALSDLVVAPVGAIGSLHRGGIAVALAPFRVYAPDESFRLYYEVYGLPEDTPYATEIEIAPVREGVIDRLRALLGDEAGLRLRFEGRAPPPHETFGAQELRTLALGGVVPGLWRVSVVVTDLTTGRAVARETTLDVGPAQ